MTSSFQCVDLSLFSGYNDNPFPVLIVHGGNQWLQIVISQCIFCNRGNLSVFTDHPHSLHQFLSDVKTIAWHKSTFRHFIRHF